MTNRPARLVGSVFPVNRWVLDTSILHHAAPAPATVPNRAGGAEPAALWLFTALTGTAAFNCRDLVGA
ncbi:MULTISPECIES: hypothetical protein [unclassified Kitasatospora]|uniref:hypothetical protein n=1 Tax=unclassified Kitasatospora TaxID=2633591 RepID=UPI0033E4617C